jgi:alpha-tubulin suppressor-like RCC1 family protein
MGDSSTAVDVVELNDITAISSGGSHTCALTRSGSVKCWGYKGSGALGNDSRVGHPADVAGVLCDVQEIYAAAHHTCLVTMSGNVRCWGRNDHSQLGDGTTTSSIVPVETLSMTSKIRSTAGGENHTCALTRSGGVKCWGSNAYGQLGNGTTLDSNTPVEVVGLNSNVEEIVSGAYHMCALTSTGEVKCWGRNNDGQLGNGTTLDSNTPVNSGYKFPFAVALTSGANHVCALNKGGGVQCWGRNMEGQLGNGTFTNSNAPVDVVGLEREVLSISAGSFHTCAKRSMEGVKCWGDNSAGQLGNGTTISQSMPVAVIGLSSGVRYVISGSEQNCARLDDDTIRCWGRNDAGQLGNGTMLNSSTPVDVINLGSLGSYGDLIRIDWSNFCVRGSSLTCWGDRSNGFRVPVDVIGLPPPIQAYTPTHNIGAAFAGPSQKVTWQPEPNLTLDFPTGMFSADVIVTHTSASTASLAAAYEFHPLMQAFALDATYAVSGPPAQPASGKRYRISFVYDDAGMSTRDEQMLHLYAWDGTRWIAERTSEVDVNTNTIMASPQMFRLWAIGTNKTANSRNSTWLSIQYHEHFGGTMELEPNDEPQMANGPLTLNQDYHATVDGPSRPYDYFRVSMPATGTLAICLQTLPINSQIQLYRQAMPEIKLAEDVEPPYAVSLANALAGEYLVRVDTGTSSSAAGPYSVRFEQMSAK